LQRRTNNLVSNVAHCLATGEVTRSNGIPKTEMYTALNGLRFIAALAIVFFHYAPKIEGYQHVPAGMRNLINQGPVALTFFFILSGFVLANRYLSAGSSVGNPIVFYRSRLGRLYPAYMVGFVLFAPLAVDKYLTHAPSGLIDWRTLIVSGILYCCMLQAWTPLAQAWNGPSWSLSVEAFMYLLFPLLGARVARLSYRNTFILLFVLWLFPVGLACTHVTGLVPTSVWEGYLRNNPIVWTPLFVMGIAGARFLGQWKKVTDKHASWMSVGALLGVVILALAWPKSLSEVFIMGGIAPLLLSVVIFFTKNSNPLTNLIGGDIFNRLGQASYVMYIVQSPVWHYWQALTNILRQVHTSTVAT
jgi:peptidoglycan/LPS O-acetylase OafA/YrhL